jgi:3-deoxy-D-manno-octulosonate 8-phosphate phosphatase (KDO 8-P phosphatase)
MEEVLARARRVQLVLFDVDGVLTDGSLYFGDDGTEYKAFYTRDGHGMKMLRECGVEIAVITGRNSPIVAHRMDTLGIQYVYQGQMDKLTPFRHLMSELRLEPEHVAYIGDDVMDLPVMLRVGLAIAVQDAHPLVKTHAHWHTPHPGGRGAARDVCDLIMQAQGRWDEQLRKYLSPD